MQPKKKKKELCKPIPQTCKSVDPATVPLPTHFPTPDEWNKKWQIKMRDALQVARG